MTVSKAISVNNLYRNNTTWQNNIKYLAGNNVNRYLYCKIHILLLQRKYDISLKNIIFIKQFYIYPNKKVHNNKLI